MRTTQQLLDLPAPAGELLRARLHLRR